MNKDFLKQVLAGEKDLLKKTEVDYINVPHYEELSVKALWPQFADDPEVSKYFPDTFAEGKGPARDYFFNVVHTVQGDFLEQLLEHANAQRMTTAGERGQLESIKISEYWEEQLKDMPYLSRKCQPFSTSSSFLSSRQARQDVAPAEGQVEALPERPQEEEDPSARHLLGVQGLQVEGLGGAATAVSISTDAAAEQPGAATSSRQHPTTPRRSSRKLNKGRQDE